MHWSKKIANDIVARYPDLKEYVVASGISPSGSVHIGNYREFITNYYVARALYAMGKRVKMIFSWDEFDRLRKVPKNVVVEGFEEHVGKPLSEIPNPFGGEIESYAGYFEAEFENALKTLRMNEIPVEFKYQAAEYKSGRYAEQVVHALKNRGKIYDIIMSFKTQEGDEGDRESYYPISVYCDKCGKDSVRVTGCSADCETVEYQCECGERRKVAVRGAKNIKLVWKADWPMRWKAENVVFEAAGIDHHSEGGSYQVASRIAREVFGCEPPMSVCYGWIGIKGLGDMHSSSGRNLTPAQLLNIYEPEILRWLYAKYAPMDAFDFGFDETIVRHYSEFDKGVKNFFEGNLSEEYDKTVFELCLFKDTKSAGKTNFGTLATIAPLAEFNEKLIGTMLIKAGAVYTADSAERIGKVRFWLENYQSDKVYKLRDSFNSEFFAGLDAEQKATIRKLHEFLKDEHTEKEIQEFLYSIINKPELTKKENLLAQQRYFRIFYNLLFGRDDGPRLYLYLAAASKEKYLKLFVE